MFVIDSEYRLIRNSDVSLLSLFCDILASKICVLEERIMAHSIFRKTSLDRVSDPEQLNDYIRVTNPGVWMIMCAVILLLAGICVWGVFGEEVTV